MFLEGVSRRFSVMIEWLLYVFVALFPFVVYRGFLYYDTSSRSYNLLIVSTILAISFGIILFFKNTKLSILKSPISLALSIFFVWLFISSYLGADFYTSFWSEFTRTAGLFYFIHLGFFYFVLTSFFEEKEYLRRLIIVFLVSTGVFSLASMFGPEGFRFIFADKKWSGFTFGNSTFAAMYLYAAFMFSLYFVLLKPAKGRNFWKNVWPIIFLFNPYFINTNFLLGRQDSPFRPQDIFGSAQVSVLAVLFSLFALFVVWLIFRISNPTIRRHVYIGVFSVGLIVAGLFSVSLLSSDGLLQKLYLTQSGTARPIVWELSKQAISDRPMAGWGVDNFGLAFEQYYDNRLLQKENGGEGWFDRAHNIFIDQSVESGYIGLVLYLLIYLVILICLSYVLFKSTNRTDRVMSIILSIYFLGHIVELQTAFDTTISYLPLIIALAIATVIFNKTVKSIHSLWKSEWSLSEPGRYILGSVIVIIFVVLFWFGTKPIVSAQVANGQIRAVGNSADRLSLYSTLFSSPADQATILWRSSYDLQRGISLTPELINSPDKVRGFVKEINFILDKYQEYINNNPQDYRARIQFAETYIYERLFDVDNLTKAHEVLDEAIDLVPSAPQAYWLKSIAYLYMGKFDLATSWADKALSLNSQIEESQRLVRYIKDSIKTFPEIDFYSFSQI